MSGFEIFNKKFFKETVQGKNITWFDTMGVLPLDSMRKATIVLSTRGYSEHYVGYDVAITHKENGNITKHFFGFNQYMTKRKDNRLADQEKFEIISYVKHDWHIAIPTDDEVKKMAEKILEFIELYR